MTTGIITGLMLLGWGAVRLYKSKGDSFAVAGGLVILICGVYQIVRAVA